MKYKEVQNFYMCEIRKDFTIDATFKGNPSRFLNHGCDPNCVLEKWLVCFNVIVFELLWNLRTEFTCTFHQDDGSIALGILFCMLQNNYYVLVFINESWPLLGHWAPVQSVIY